MNQSEYILKSAQKLMDYKPSQAMASWPIIKSKFLTAVIEYVEGSEKSSLTPLSQLGGMTISLTEEEKLNIVEEAKKIFEIE
jgi:hypothetical protein